jgi:hypothetical protein
MTDQRAVATTRTFVVPLNEYSRCRRCQSHLKLDFVVRVSPVKHTYGEGGFT